MQPYTILSVKLLFCKFLQETRNTFFWLFCGIFFLRTEWLVSDLSFFNWWYVLNTKPQLEKMILWSFLVLLAFRCDLSCLFTGKTPRWTGPASTNVFSFQSFIWTCKWLMILFMDNKPFLRRLKRWTLDNMVGSNKKPPYF